MSKLIVDVESNLDKDVTMCAHSIPIGEIFTGQTDYGSSVYLRTYSGIVDLKNARNTWTLNINISKYKPTKEAILSIL